MLVIGSNTAALRAANAIRFAQAAAREVDGTHGDRQAHQLRGGRSCRLLHRGQDGEGYPGKAAGGAKRPGWRGLRPDGRRVLCRASRICSSEFAELATTSASGTYSDDNRANMQVELTQLVDQIKGVLTSSDFNGIKLFQPSGGTGDVTFSQVLTTGRPTRSA